MSIELGIEKSTRAPSARASQRAPYASQLGNIGEEVTAPRSQWRVINGSAVVKLPTMFCMLHLLSASMVVSMPCMGGMSRERLPLQPRTARTSRGMQTARGRVTRAEHRELQDGDLVAQHV